MLIDEIRYILHLDRQCEVVFLLATVNDKSCGFLLLYQAVCRNKPNSAFALSSGVKGLPSISSCIKPSGKKVNKVNKVNGLTPICMTLQNTLLCPALPTTTHSLIYLQ